MENKPIPLFIWMSCVLRALGEVQPCRSSHLNGTLAGYHCPSHSDTIADIHGAERRQCFLFCMKQLDCVFLEYNEDKKQCRLAKGVCFEAEERGNVEMAALGPPRLGCIEWRKNDGTLPQNLLVLVNEFGDARLDKVFGRLSDGGFVLPGFGDQHPITVKSTHNGQVKSSTTGEFLLVSPGCPILWVPWRGTPGADLPKVP